MKRTWKTPIIVVSVLILVSVLSYFGYNTFTKSPNKVSENYMKTKATKGTIAVNVTASGTAASEVAKDIVSQNNGTVDSFTVKPGDNIKAGQSIGNIIDTSSTQNLQKAQNTLAQDNLKLAQLNKSLNSLYIKAPVSGTVESVNAAAGDDAALVSKILHAVIISYTGDDGKTMSVNIDAPSGIISNIYVSTGDEVNKGDKLFRLSADDINNSIASQNIVIQQDKLTLSNAQTQVDYNNLKSPIDGTISDLNFNPGDTVQAEKIVATILDLTKMQTVVAVDELDIDKVKVGQKATISIDALTGKSFIGEVLKVSSIGKTTNAVTTYDVTVSIDNPVGIKTGMTTNVSIGVQSKDNIVMLPIEAVQGSGNNRYVTVETIANIAPTTSPGSSSKGQRSGGSFTTSIASRDVARKKVQTGISNQNYIEITGGVTEGDSVLIPIVKSATSTTTTKSSNPFGGTTGGSGGYSGARGGQ